MTEEHIYYVDEVEGVRPNETADHLIGALLIIVALTGIGGNIPAAIYFWRKRKSSLPDLLYTIISITDTCTSTVTLLAIPPLFNSRRPTLLKPFPVCVVFALLFNHGQKFSVHMVMMISTTRAIKMLRPFYKINKKGVIATCLGFEILWAALEATFLGSGRMKVIYANQPASCGLAPLPTDKLAFDLYMALFLGWVMTSMLVILVSFLLSVGTVAVRRRSTVRQINESQFMDASITITLFSTICFFCFLPLFVIHTSTTIAYFVGTYWVLEKNGAFSWYGLLVAHTFLTSFNAAANPCLYFARMTRYRAWLFRTINQRLGIVRSPERSRHTPILQQQGTRKTMLAF